MVLVASINFPLFRHRLMLTWR